MKSKIKSCLKYLLAVGIVIGSILLFGDINDNSIDVEKEVSKVLSIIDEYEDTRKLKTEGNLVIYFLDVGQADAILVENNNKFMLIDAGNYEDGKNIVDFLKRRGVTKLDSVIATHVHDDHIGGMARVINNFEIGKFYMPDTVFTSKTFEYMIDALEKNNVKVTIPKVGDSIFVGNAKFKVLSIDNNLEDINATSIVVRGLYGKNSFLFMGDAEKSVEDKLLDTYINSNLLKVGHHGSRYASSTKFLEAVKPEFSVITVGNDNTYLHPHTEALERLKAAKTKIYRTDKSGTIVATSDGSNITMTSIRTKLDGNVE